MWVVFGFVTLISFSIYSGYKRINAAWIGVSRDLRDISFQYKTLRSRYGVVGLLVGVDGLVGYDFSFKKESLVDRFFKLIGFSKEYQSGRKAFDDLVYVVSDNSQLHRQISSNEKVSQAIIEAFNLADAYGCKLKEIRNNSGRLWVRYKVSSGFDENSIFYFSVEAAKILKVIANEIDEVPLLSGDKWKDPFVIKAAIILAASTGLAINGLVHLIRLLWTNVPFTVDSDQLLTDSIYSGFFLIVLLIFISVMILGRSARTHLVLMELLLVGTFGAVSTSYSELRDINIELDSSVVMEYEVKALGKEMKETRRSRYYYLYLNDWNWPGLKKKVEVSGEFYRSVSKGDSILVRQKNGYLKYKWVESLERKPESLSLTISG